MRSGHLITHIRGIKQGPFFTEKALYVLRLMGRRQPSLVGGDQPKTPVRRGYSVKRGSRNESEW